MKASYSDEELVKMIQSGQQLQISKAMNFLYRAHFEAISNWLQPLPPKLKAIDVFVPKLTDLVLNIMTGKAVISPQATIKTLLYSYCGYGKKNQWRNNSNENKLKNKLLPPIKQEETAEEKEKKAARKKAFLASLISKIGKNCQKSLKEFYFGGKTNKEIAQIMGFKSEQQSRNLLSKCRKKLKKMILEHPNWEDYLT